MKKSNRIIAVLLVMVMIFSTIPMTASAKIIAAGAYGENLAWTLDDSGTLTFTGTGTIDDNYSYESGIYEYGDVIAKVVISDGVTGIGNNAFCDYFNLKEVIMADSVTIIGDDAFEYCESLTVVKFSRNLKRIYDGAFQNCMNLKQVTLPESLEYIGTSAFIGTSVASLHIPKNVRTIEGPLVYSGCFTGYTVDENNQYFSVDEYGNLFNKNKTRLIHHPLRLDEKEYTIPDTVEVIGLGAFAYNVYLEKINIPESVKEIQGSAFLYCVLLKELNIPKGVEKLSCSEMAFYLCISLKSFSIPADFTFTDCQYDRDYDDGYDDYENDHNHLGDLYRQLIYCYCLKEVTIYDKNLDFSSFPVGFWIEKIKNTALFDVYCELLAKYQADYTAYSFGYIEEPEEPEINFDDNDMFDRNAVPELTVTIEGDRLSLYTVPGFTLRCYKNSTAEEYAKKYGFNIKYICDEHVEEVIPGIAATCTETGITDGVKCSVCGEILVEQTEIPTNEHSYESFVLKDATCIADGIIEYYCECGDEYETEIPAIGHIDSDADSLCDSCGSSLCSHMCHQSGFSGFIWKIVQFFWKLFNMNPLCECGASHY